MAIGDLNDKSTTFGTPATSASTRASIGPSVSVNGEISGEEDILIEGNVEGLINLKKNVVTVAASGKVKAAIYGMVIHVEGEITGDLYGTERVVIHKSGRVTGNVTAPRISLEDGAKLKGTVSTEATGTEATANRSFDRNVGFTKVEEFTTDLAKKPGFLKTKDTATTQVTNA